MKRVVLALIVVLASWVSCQKSDSDSVVLVAVNNDTDLSSVTQLQANITLGGLSTWEYFPETNSGVAIAIPTSFSLTLPHSRQGTIAVAITAVDAAGTPLATGQDEKAIVAGGQTDLSVLLQPTLAPDNKDAGGAQDSATETIERDSGAGGATTGTGGTGMGGTVATGGAIGTGGAVATGGAIALGGTTGHGGTTENGGTIGTGGATARGGSGGSITGGTIGTGGKIGTGGSIGSGGVTSTTIVPPPAGGSGGGTTSTAAACTPPITSTGGLSCPGGLCTISTTIAGYAYSFADKGGSKICLDPNSLCANGTTAVADSKGTIWGAGMGFNLDKSSTPAAVQITGTGMTYALSSLPTQGLRATVTVGTTDYCVKLVLTKGTVAWTDFNTACWDNSGTKLSGAPLTPHVGFEVTAAATASSFDFCVTTVSFQ